MIKKIALLIMILVFVSCNTKKSVIQTTRKGSKTNTSVVRNYKKTTSKKANETQTLEATTRVKVTNDMILAYIEKYNAVAQANRNKYGIPASIILGQAILESGSGTGPLCVQANNHFGIKCHKDWTGASISFDDDTVGECFRKYDNPYDSFRDHALFLTTGLRYISLFTLDKKDYKAWAKGLKDAGYATDSQYPTKLIAIIERFQLYKYDGGTLEKEPVYANEKVASNPSEYQVSPGDTLYSISRKFKLSIDELKNKNNMSDNTISIGQSLKVN
ncbi:glucosaminidase domain-containing protein [Flavobacterium sp.]|uniref:glucosaminidase domain-containing protein n=1 Tax=Flavobacterium sp. TaxID=239 RepID=UPI0037A6C025